MKQKCYTFNCRVAANAHGFVLARSKKEALEKLANGEYADILDEADQEYSEFEITGVEDASDE